jgi:hypothetical protein
MRAYCSLFVDAGYLMAAASTRLTGTPLRSAVEVDVPGLLEDVSARVQADCGLPLLRVSWYDAGGRAGTPDQRQREIAELPGVKVRLGRLGANAEGRRPQARPGPARPVPQPGGRRCLPDLR